MIHSVYINTANHVHKFREHLIWALRYGTIADRAGVMV